MSSYSTIVFPAPPPTHNTLTLTERSQLLRSNAKISQLLGSTPHVLDETRWNKSTYSLSSSSKKARRRSLPSSSYEPSTSGSSSLTSSTVDLSQSRSSCDSSTSSDATCASEPRSLTYPHTEESWRIPFSSAQKPPILRLGKSNGSSLSSLSHSSSKKPKEVWDPDMDEYSPTTPNFSIPSESTMRRMKMARLRKRLGEDVPVHLVFPPIVESESDEEEITCSTKLPPPPADPVVSTPDPRRSRFVHTKGPIGTRPSVVTVRYDDVGTHGFESETFKGLTFTCRRITTIPEE